jgi:hypothetical protein
MIPCEVQILTPAQPILVMFALVRADEPLRAFLTRSTYLPVVIPFAHRSSLLDRFPYLNRPLVPAAPTVPDITIHRTDRPVGTTTAARLATLIRVGTHCGLLR